jgi:RNA polymerase sigma-70 factor (ECF subfamily)
MARLSALEGGRAVAARFESLIEPHYDVLYRAAYRLTRSVHDAEDLVQEVCVRAFARIDELENFERPRAWLLRVLQRLFIDQTRRYDRRHVQSIETSDWNAWVSDAADPADAAEQSSTRRQLNRAWQHLDRMQQVLLALHDIEGYSLAELQQITGFKEGTLKSRLHRARVRLGKLVQRDNSAGLGAHGKTGVIE